MGDLTKYPIWEYTIDEEGIPDQDETWVRPLPRKTVPKEAYSLQVRAEFTTPLGKIINGFMDVCTANRKIEIRNGVMVEPEYLFIPQLSREKAISKNAIWCIEERDNILKTLDCDEAEVFPLKYSLKVKITGERNFRQGIIT